MPITALAFWVAAFSISGVPLFNGFVSKGMVLLAAEHANLWLWVLLEIASFGTFLSFLKLGYFAFLRPGSTEASDPPLPMQVAMIGITALCIMIGVYPPLLYTILPISTPYQAFDPISLVETLLILCAAGAFFFTVGRRLLEPHDTRMKDVDVAYIAAGRGIISFAGCIQTAFRTIYDGATVTALSLFQAGKWVMWMEDRDVNWNSVAFGFTLVIVMALVLVGVSF
jgi:multicomponent Na+:H+ antiporter subunit D